MGSLKTPAPMPEGVDFILKGIPGFEEVGRDSGRKLMALAHIKGATMSADSQEARPPVCISAVVDKSGSMRGEKLQLVKQTLSFVVRELSDQDLFGVIAYNNGVSEVLPLTRMDAAGKRRAKAAVETIHEGGGTNLSGGLLAGVDQMAGKPFTAPAPIHDVYSGLRGYVGRSSRRVQPPPSPFPVVQGIPVQMQQHPIPVPSQQLPIPSVEEKIAQTPIELADGTVCAAWLFTDGMANAGITDTAEIVAAMQARMQGTRSASVFTFGYGVSHNSDTLRSIAEAANGMYYFIETPDSIPGAFAECLGGVLSVVAQNLTVQVRAAPGVELLSVLGQEDVQSDGTSARLTLRDLYSEEERDLLLELNVSPSAGEILATLQLRLTDARSGQIRELEAEIAVRRPDRVDAPQVPNERVDEQRNRVVTAQALAAARQLAEAGMYAEARKALMTARRHVETSPTGMSPFSRDLADDLSANCEAMESASVYMQRGSKLAAQTAQCHTKQRSCAISPGISQGGVSKERYTNARQRSLKSKFTPHP